MRIEFVPLLGALREVYALPRDRSRFEGYIALVTGGKTDDLDLSPLLVANPMAREHVSACLDGLLALGAEGIGARAAAAASERLAEVEPETTLRAGLVVADDVRGGWTNRHLTEAGLRFPEPNRRRGHDPDSDRNRWATVLLWASDEPDAGVARRETLGCIYRAAHHRRFGVPSTLAAMLAQEGRAAAFAGETPRLSPAALARARAVVHPLRDAPDTAYPAAFACLYGDDAAESVGTHRSGCRRGRASKSPSPTRWTRGRTRSPPSSSTAGR
jgi:hypothetical protein